MIQHLAMFTFVDGTTPAEVEELTARLAEMAEKLPSLRSYHAGPNLRLRPSDADYAVSAVVDDEAGLAAYLDSDVHKEVYDTILGRLIDQRQAAQLDIG
jgi:hypothetical protein